MVCDSLLWCMHGLLGYGVEPTSEQLLPGNYVWRMSVMILDRAVICQLWDNYYANIMSM